jgi:transcription antitermination factor NusG
MPVRRQLFWRRYFRGTCHAARIADGQFAEFLGTLEYLDAAGRVRVLIDLLGRTVSVTLRCEALMSAT